MKISWIVLLVSAGTDFVITAATGLNAAMFATGVATMPSEAVILVSLLGGAIAWGRTIQQGLKAAMGSESALLGNKPKEGV